MKTFGANVTKHGVDFQVWAPEARVELLLLDESSRELRFPMASDDGIHSVSVSSAQPGMRYQFQLGTNRYPDPYTRFQPEGPHGASLIIDPKSHQWQDLEWRGIHLDGQVFYELHVGAFTEQGTFDAAIERLPWLRSLGITTIELMPIAEFPGRFNWGYDGVNLFAPYHGYGSYNALKRFVDAAHRLELGVILDVVYNHLGPTGNYLPCFSPHYFATDLQNEWGTPFNVDGPHREYVRRYLIENACYWVSEFHLDGLRLDATTNIPDKSDTHILAEIVDAVRTTAAPRGVLIVAEDEQQQSSRLLPRERGGFGFDAMWNDDFHHSAQVALQGKRQAYFYDYRGAPQEFISSAKRGFLFQGEVYRWQKQPRGQRLRRDATACISFIDNHDQIANTLRGLRSTSNGSAAKLRALTAFWLLMPQTPMFFMGQEFGAKTPFYYFADQSELKAEVMHGRGEFLKQFPWMNTPAAQMALLDPTSESTFINSKLAWQDYANNTESILLHRDLLQLRREDAVIRDLGKASLDGAVLSEHAFLLRWFNDAHGDRILIVNLGGDIDLDPNPEPLLAPSQSHYWSLLFSSARIEYGGNGVEFPETEVGWSLPAESAILLCERSTFSALDPDVSPA
jgi:maltooligosyltrehalose trehalohydrolase